MPTPNEFNRIIYGGSDSTGRQDGPAKEYGQVDPSSILPGPTSGDYPDTFGGYGEHYSGASGNYPDTFSRIDLGGDNTSSYTRRSSQGVTGNFEQARPEAGFGPKASTNQVPNPVPSKQFSSDTNGDPKALLAQATSSIDAHSSYLEACGLRMPVATMGTHPWLRDSCTNTSEQEPGQAAPSNGQLKVPMRKNV